jgi:hypothetical protein
VSNNGLSSPQWSAASTAADYGPEVVQVPQDYGHNDWSSSGVGSYPQHNDWSNSPIGTYPQHTEKGSTGVAPAEVGLEPVPYQNKPKSRRWVWIAVAVAVVVIVGAVVGGVVGSRASRSSSDSVSKTDPSSSVTSSAVSSATTTATAGASPTTSATPQSIRPNSRLAVTGWQANGEVTIDLFYQDPSGNIRYSNFDSSGNWSASIKTSASAVSGTGMGASSFVLYTPAQAEYFYINNAWELTGENFRVGYTPTTGSTDSVANAQPVAADIGSNVASYWPYVALQKPDGGLQLVTYMLNGAWSNQTLPLTASKGTGIAIVPQTATYASPYKSGLLYRTEDGQLGGYWLAFNQTGTAWEWSSSGMLLFFNCFSPNAAPGPINELQH